MSEKYRSGFGAQGQGKGMLALRLPSAMELMEARREASHLTAMGHGERAICANACLLARVLTEDGKLVFADGQAVLCGLRVEEIQALACRWSKFNAKARKKPWRRKGGVWSWISVLRSGCDGKS